MVESGLRGKLLVDYTERLQGYVEQVQREENLVALSGSFRLCACLEACTRQLDTSYKLYNIVFIHILFSKTRKPHFCTLRSVLTAEDRFSLGSVAAGAGELQPLHLAAGPGVGGAASVLCPTGRDPPAVPGSQIVHVRLLRYALRPRDSPEDPNTVHMLRSGHLAEELRPSVQTASAYSQTGVEDPLFGLDVLVQEGQNQSERRLLSPRLPHELLERERALL